MKQFIFASVALFATSTLAVAGMPSILEHFTDHKGPAVERVAAKYANSQWFIDPETGCQYSRAQAPGYAPTWHIILNPHSPKAVPAHAACPPQLTLRQ